MTEPQISDEAIGAAAFAARRVTAGTLTVDQTLDVVHAVLAAAVPHLHRQWEAELRAQIADDIEAERSDSDEWEYAMGLLKAAAIARGGGYDPALDGPRGAQPGGQQP